MKTAKILQNIFAVFINLHPNNTVIRLCGTNPVFIIFVIYLGSIYDKHA